jgi:hypothetical protein
MPVIAVTPKEKAFELVQKYMLHTPIGFYIEDAKKCSLIAVDELIESHLLLTTTHDSEPSIRCKRYWQEVKNELIKL